MAPLIFLKSQCCQLCSGYFRSVLITLRDGKAALSRQLLGRQSEAI